MVSHPIVPSNQMPHGRQRLEMQLFGTLLNKFVLVRNENK